MAAQSKGTSVPVTSITYNKLLTVQNSLCEASSVVHFWRGIFFKATDKGDGIELSPEESCGFIHLMDDLSKRIESLICELDECREGARHG
ncbi:hypothetical protein SAMN05216386_1657 [Nitrosospira briensis]|uniref:Uncharacterized protein n=2 Tax=Nitrosospira briensis TaxID=35799 RepID=A0A1I5B4S6_9PROT|nr:hypothetical protein SAMN05216386_1657 [Nitrosospira briensis]